MTNLELEKKVKELEKQLNESIAVISRLGKRVNDFDQIISTMKDENLQLQAVVNNLRTANNNVMDLLKNKSGIY